MEKSKATSELVYEDEFSYITEEGQIYRKRNSHQAEKQLGEVDTGDAEAVIAEYRSNFVQLEEQVEDLSGPVTDEQIQEWQDKLEQADAVGNFDRLYSRLDELGSIAGEEEAEDTDESTVVDEPKDKAEGGADDDNRNEFDSTVDYYKDLMKQARETAQSEDWQKADRKLDELSHQWSDGPNVEGEEAGETIKDLYSKFTNAEQNFEKRKEQHFSEADKKRKENLVGKRELLKEIEKIVKAGDWSATGKIKSLESKWYSIGSVPKEQAADIADKYESLIKEFKSHKVDRLVEKRQKQEDNLMMKMAVLDKMGRVADDIDDNTTNWKEIDDTFSDLTKQWKKIGRVPREKSNQVWSRYKSAQDLYYDNKYKYHKDHRSNVDSFTAKKQNICEEAEVLVEQKDIAKAAREVNKLHHRWKKIGNLPQRREDKLWDRFKAATDAFNERKSNNIDKLHEQEEKHYQQKLKLIEKAEEVKETTDWDKGHQQMQSFMDRWKKIGPVPRKKSNKIWKQFKGAMDVFYDRRRKHFKEAKEQQKDNLKRKQEILEELRALGQHEDPIAAVDEAKKLQSEFKDVGYVPIKKKNEMWKKYREVCDVIYDRMRAAKSGDKFDQELAKASLDPEQRSQIQDLRREYKKIEKEVRSLKKEVLQLEESKTNFNFSNDDNPLLKDMNEKINKMQAKLESRQNKMEALSMEMEDIKEEA